MSRRPNVATARSTIAAVWLSSVTSQVTQTAWRPAEVRSPAAACTASLPASASTTAAPALAKARAVASPMPDAAPVTSATLFSKL